MKTESLHRQTQISNQTARQPRLASPPLSLTPNFGWAGLNRACKNAVSNRFRQWLFFFPRPRNSLSLLAATLASLCLTGCVTTPQTTIRGTIHGCPFSIQAPKDGDLTGLDFSADTNGLFRIHIDRLTVKMNPAVITQSGLAETSILQATGELASNVTAAAVSAAIHGK